MIFLLEKKLYIYRIFLKSPYLTYFWKFWYETVVIATDITLYLLTELGAPKVIKYNALVSFYYEVSLGSFEVEICIFSPNKRPGAWSNFLSLQSRVFIRSEFCDDTIWIFILNDWWTEKYAVTSQPCLYT